MLRRLMLALVAAALALGGAAVPAVASGSADLFPRVGASDPACDATHPCRAALEWRTNAYGPAGDTRIQRRTLLTVFARAGEKILTGSSSIGSGSADILVWNPGVVTDTEAATLPTVVDGVNGFSCAAHRPSSASPVGRLTTRTQELARAQSVDGTRNTAGYVPCVYTAPTEGLYRVAFLGSAGMSNAADGSPDRHLDPSGGFLAAAGSSVNAWDLTVRSGSDPTSVVDLPGRTFTYVLAGFTGGNPRPVTMTLYLTTLDGYRYAVDTHGFDPNGFVFYGNRAGFLDADGTTPLNHDVVGTGTDAQTLPALLGGVHLAPPEYPLSFEPLAPETLAALAIPGTPVEPTLSAVDFTGRATAHGSFVGQGGTFTLRAASGGTYEIVISRDGVDFDPGLPGNRALRGLVPAGTFTVTWDGKDNAGLALPVKDDHYDVRAVLRAGEYHAPMLDVESSTLGGPRITLLNPPDGVCPFSLTVSTGTNCTSVFYDDRTYVTSAGTRVGSTASGTLCEQLSGAVPTDLFADPRTGVDSRSAARAFGDGGGLNANQHCPATGGTLGDAKGLDLWTYFPSQETSTWLDVLPDVRAVDDTGTTSVGTPLVVPAALGVLTNDIGGGLTVASSTTPGHGTVVTNPDGSFTYTPDAGHSGADEFDYTVVDDQGRTDVGTVHLTVTPLAADDDLGTVPADVTTTGTLPGVLANDAGSGLTVTHVGTPAHGTVAIAPDGTWTYTPPAGWSGRDTVTYTATDSSGQTTEATVSIRVSPATPPAAVDDTATGVRDQPTTLTELANDTPGDHHAWDLGTVRLVAPVSGLLVSTVTVPGQGTWTVEPGRVRFTPETGFHGDARLQYEVTNTVGQTVTATMTVTYPPLAQLIAPPVVAVPTPASPATPQPTGLTVTVTVRGGGLATTGADPFPALLLAFSLVVAGAALSHRQRRHSRLRRV